ncbi:hypothetical protein ACGH7X_39070 [Streptomyces sp. BBFR51]|uniref:hypothetical protein n=1 Tax=Streptomyces sp. BBFR51 TaxID=3372856 RepID=UPI0037DDDE67
MRPRTPVARARPRPGLGERLSHSGIGAATRPLPPEREAGFWYFCSFLTERSRAGLAADPREVARVIWEHNSPGWAFHARDLDRPARAFANPDYTDVVVHFYRHRLGFAPGADAYAELEARLAALPPVPVPTLTGRLRDGPALAG